MAKAWIGESLLQLPVAGEQEQAFAVGIQAACGIDPGSLIRSARQLQRLPGSCVN